MDQKKKISIDQFNKKVDNVPDHFFDGLESNIMRQTVEKAELKTKLFLILNAKPVGFEALNVVPNYFESLENRILESTSAPFEKQLWLQTKLEIDFKVSEEYFEGLTGKIQSRIPFKKRSREEWIWLPQLIKQPIYLMAASVLSFALALGYIQLQNRNQNQDIDLAIGNLNNQDISNYIATRTELIDIESISNGNWEEELKEHELSSTEVNELILTDEL